MSSCMAVGLACQPVCGDTLQQSRGQCQDLNHELFKVVSLCCTGCRYPAAWVQSWWSRQDVDGTVHFAAVLRLRVSGFVTEFELGRQAAWRPRCNRGGVVKTLMALCILLLCCGCVSRTLYAGFELGRQAAWWPRCNRGCVDKTVVGIVHSAAGCGCVSLGLSVQVRARSLCYIMAEGQSCWCRQDVETLCSLLVFMIACYLGSVCEVHARSSDDGRPSAIRLVLSN